MLAGRAAVRLTSMGSLAAHSRSASASNGLALACTPLSPTFGSPLRSRDFQFEKITFRSEPSAAVAGSVAPSTLPRKSSQLSFLGSHSTR